MPTKHSKKAWRKRRDTDETVEEGLEKDTHDKLHGTDFEQVPSAELFYEDKVASAPAAPATEAAQGRLHKRQRVLKSEAILAAGRAVRPIGTHPPKSSKPARAAKQAARRQQRPQQQQAVTEAAALDIWGDEAQQPGAARRTASANLRRPSAPARPAVEVDQPGCSYNPDAGQHQDAVAAAVAAEVQKQLAAELAPKPLEMAATSEAKQDDLRLLQVDQAADEAPQEADDAAGAVGIDRRIPATKTKTQRNKEQRHRQAEAELKARKQQKEVAKSINQLKQLAEELSAEEELRAATALRKQISKLEKQAEGPPRLGKTPFVQEAVHVLLSEELNGSLRSLKATSMLARDRFKSLQKRGLLEPRTRVRKHVGKRIASETYANRQAGRDLMV